MVNPYSYVTKPKENFGTYIGEGSSTWWTGEAIGRSYGGVDEWYIGGVKATPEDVSASTIPEKQGIAVPVVYRVQVESDPTGANAETMTITETGINKTEAKYVCDEHHQPTIFDNKKTGQLVISWGSRGNAVDPEDDDLQRILYGSDSASLSAVESVQWETVPNYAQIFSTGNNVYVWSRININTWGYSVGAGGQNYTQGSEKFLDAGAGVQYYLNQKYIDSTECGGTDSADLRSRIHCFGQSHPTISPDRTLRYAMAEYVVGGTYDSEYSEAGLIYKQPTSGTKLGTNGKLGEMGTLAPTDLETAIQFTGNQTYRILDVQLGFAPRALLCVFEGTWAHGDTIPLGTPWNLVLVQYNEWSKSWSQFTVKSDLRGALGYAPWATAQRDSGAIEHGQEGFTSYYAHGACFYRGKSGYDVAPIIYLAHRLGDDMNEHRLTEIRLNDSYDAVVDEIDLTPLTLSNSEVDWSNLNTHGIPSYRQGINGSQEIIYRPNAVRGGNKRGLFFNKATGWSLYTSYVASVHALPLTYTSSLPRISQQTESVTGSVNEWVTLGVTAENTGSAEITYQWYYKDTGDSDYTIIAGSTKRTHEYNIQPSGDGRVYQVRVTNLNGTTSSADIPVTVV